MEFTEDQEQAAFFQILEKKWPEAYKMCFHVPNGGRRDIRGAVRLKRQGVKPGVPDIFLMIPRGIHYALVIELKRPFILQKPRPSLTSLQRNWIDNLNAYGYLAVVCYGADEAMRYVDDYMRLKYTDENNC